MEPSAKLFELVRDLLVQIPSLLAIVGCIVAAFVKWRRYPKVSLLVLIGLVLLFLQAFIFAFTYAFVPDLFAKPDDFRTQQTIASIISFFYHTFRAFCLAFLLAAIFMKRKEVPPRAQPTVATL